MKFKLSSHHNFSLKSLKKSIFFWKVFLSNCQIYTFSRGQIVLSTHYANLWCQKPENLKFTIYFFDFQNILFFRKKNI